MRVEECSREKQDRTSSGVSGGSSCRQEREEVKEGLLMDFCLIFIVFLADLVTGR